MLYTCQFPAPIHLLGASFRLFRSPYRQSIWPFSFYRMLPANCLSARYLFAIEIRAHLPFFSGCHYRFATFRIADEPCPGWRIRRLFGLILRSFFYLADGTMLRKSKLGKSIYKVYACLKRLLFTPFCLHLRFGAVFEPCCIHSFAA